MHHTTAAIISGLASAEVDTCLLFHQSKFISVPRPALATLDQLDVLLLPQF
jgi:hypothetical protein